MKSPNKLIGIVLLFCILMLSLTVLDFLALHDIKQDYLSQKMLDLFEISFSKEIPDWTATVGEWGAVTISLYARFLLVLSSIILMAYYIFNLGSDKKSA